jgi:outer membrane protein assembly factor BamB
MRGLPYVPSPLYYDGRIYLVKNGGLASCLDTRTGEFLYQEERLGALGDYYASPGVAAGKICVASQQGVVVIHRAGDTLDVLARNALGEPILATLAMVEDKLYVRTKSQLYAFSCGDNPTKLRDDNSQSPATHIAP